MIDNERSDDRIAVLRESILRAFPVETYTGSITNYDGNWSVELADGTKELLDDDKFLFEAVNGRKWPEIAKEYLESAPDGFGLFSDEALPFYLGAWLTQSLDAMDGENIVREFVVYTFCSTMRKFRVLNAEQQAVIRMLMVEFSERDPSSFIRERASEAIALIDRKRY